MSEREHVESSDDKDSILRDMLCDLLAFARTPGKPLGADQAAVLNYSAAIRKLFHSPDSPCTCRRTCGDTPEDTGGTCKGLPATRFESSDRRDSDG